MTQRQPFPIIPDDDVAKLLAGLPVTSRAAQSLARQPAYQEHAEWMERRFSIIETNRLVPMRQWAARELAEININTNTLFYIFGGPDLTTALELFPAAATYVLIGLEPPGEPPRLGTRSGPSLTNLLHEVRHSLRDFFQGSYFKTLEMDIDLREGRANGTIPLMLAMLSRAGYTVGAVAPVEFTPAGGLVALESFPRFRRPKKPYGVKIEAAINGHPRTVYYFTHDLRDDTFTVGSPGHRFYTSLGFETSFLKAASYLMHFREFATVRELVVSRSRYILQDDTGVPYRYLKGRYTVKCYGELSRPVEAFNDVRGTITQLDLKAVYARPDIAPMQFHMGYHWTTQSDAWMRCEKIRAGAPAAGY